MTLATGGMQGFTVANPYVDDRERLGELWDENGYLYFEGFLDAELVRSFREAILTVLVGDGFAEADVELPTWTGKPLESATSAAVHRLGLAKQLFERPEVQDLLERVFGEPVRFIPIVEYRHTPPAGAGGPPHQDGFFNPGLSFRVCWVPLMTIDETVGGLALAEGMHKGGYLHDETRPPSFPIPDGVVPEDRWRRTTYRPGDFLIMSQTTPHRGLPNQSDKTLRVTMDFRVVGISEPQPTIGVVTAVTAEAITVRSEDGGETSFVVDDGTHVRPNRKRQPPVGQKASAWIDRHDLPADFPVGAPVMVAAEGAKALYIRTPVYTEFAR